MKQIHSAQAPKAVGPYSQAIQHQDTIYCSGQIGLNPQTNQLETDLEKQTHQVLKNLNHVLNEAGSNLSKVVKTTIYLSDIKDYKLVNAIYAQYFQDTKPARATVQVAALPIGALVEIECIATT